MKQYNLETQSWEQADQLDLAGKTAMQILRWSIAVRLS